MKKNLINRALTSTAAVALVASAMSINLTTTLAEEPTELTELNMVKLFNTREDTAIPTVTFDFTAAPKTITDGTTKEFNKTDNTGTFSVNVYSGVAGVLYDDSTTTDTTVSTAFTAPTSADGLKTSTAVTASWTIDNTPFNAEGTNYQPGLYAYTITEDTLATAIEGVTQDTSSYNVYLYVERNSEEELIVTGKLVYKVTDGAEATAKDGGTTEDGTGATGDYMKFTNKYGVDNTTPGGDPEDPEDPAKDTVNNFYVTKHITGNQADKSKKFAFTISGTAQKGDTIVGVAPDGTKSLVLVADAGTFSFTTELTEGETFKVTGLSASDTVSATETAGDYTATFSEADTNTLESIAIYVATNGFATAKGITTDTYFHVNNDKSGEIPTGVIMTYGPYVAMVIIAAGLFFVFARKKEEQENY